MSKKELSVGGVPCGRALAGCSTVLGFLYIQGRVLVRCEFLHCCAPTHVHEWIVQLGPDTYRSLEPGEREMVRA